MLESPDVLRRRMRAGVISFAGVIPDPALFPVETAAEAYRDVLADPQRAAAALQYSVGEGYAPLRKWIARHMAEQGTPATPDNIVITAGSQQASISSAKCPSLRPELIRAPAPRG